MTAPPPASSRAISRLASITKATVSRGIVRQPISCNSINDNQLRRHHKNSYPYWYPSFARNSLDRKRGRGSSSRSNQELLVRTAEGPVGQVAGSGLALKAEAAV